MSSQQYEYSPYKDKIVSSLFYFHDGNPDNWKAVFYIRAPRGQNVAAIALDRRFLGTIIAVFKNNTMEIIHAIRTLRIVCGFLDMEDWCYLIFNKNQLMFVEKSNFVLFVTIKSHLVKPLSVPS